MISPGALQRLIIRHSALDSKTYKLSKINKEYKAINGSDEDPDFFEDISKINSNQKTSVARSLKAFRSSTEIKQDRSSGRELRYERGHLIQYTPLTLTDSLDRYIVKRSGFLNTSHIPPLSQELVDSQFQPLPGETEPVRSRRGGSGEHTTKFGFIYLSFSHECFVNIGNGIIYDEDLYDEDLYDEDVYPEDDPEAVAAAMNSSRSGGMGLKHSSRSRSFRHHHEEEAQSSRSRSARQQPEQETHYHSSRATQPNQDSRGCSYPVQQASSYDNEDDNANERNSVLKQNVIVDGHQVDFQFALELNEQGFCSSNEPFNTFGSYSFKGMAADDGEAFPTFTVIFPYMSMVDDLTECSTKHIT